MTQEGRLRPETAGLELLEGTTGAVPRVTLTALAPVARLRSPIMERRPFVLPPPADDRVTVPLPPLSAFVGASGLALLVATPVFLMAGWQVAIVAAVLAPVARQLRRWANRLTFSIGDGFLPYRAETGWPKGVREDDDVRWNWSTAASTSARGEMRARRAWTELG